MTLIKTGQNYLKLIKYLKIYSLFLFKSQNIPILTLKYLFKTNKYIIVKTSIIWALSADKTLNPTISVH